MRAHPRKPDGTDREGRNAAGKIAMLSVTLRPRVHFSGERLPSLEDVVTALPPHMQLVCDFKHGEERFPGFAASVAEVVRPLGSRFAALSIDGREGQTEWKRPPAQAAS